MFTGHMSMPVGAGHLQAAIVANALRVFNAGALGGLRTAGVYIGNYYSSHLKTQYSMIGTGRPYKDPRTGIRTRASVPGSPPAAQTGDLRDSVRHSVSRKPGRNPVNGQFVKGFGRVEIKVYTHNPYAADLEYGTSKISPRPNWGPTRRNPMILTIIKSNTKARFVAAERAAAGARMTALPITTFGREGSRRG